MLIQLFLNLTLLFIIFLSSYSLGHLLTKKLALKLESFPITLGIGFCIQMLLTFILVHFFGKHILMLFIFVQVILIYLNLTKIIVISKKLSKDRMNIYLFFLSLICFIPSTYFDPLNYHLAAMKIWGLEDNIINPSSSMPLYHTGLFDYLFIYPFLIMKTIDIKDLIAHQIYAQFVHYFFGFFLTVLIFKKILKLLNIRNSYLIVFVILVFASRGSLQHKAFIAKNDWAAMYFGLLGSYLFLTSKRRSDIFFLAGVFHGLVFSIKFTSILGTVPFILLGVKKFNIKNLTCYLLGFCLLACVIPLRNYIWTGNPFFPVFNSFFESDLLTTTWSVGFSKFEENGLVFERIYKVLGQQWINVFYFFGIFLKDRKLKLLWVYNSLILFFFSIISGPSAEYRAIGISSALIPMFSSVLIYQIFKKNKIILRATYTLIFLNILHTLFYIPNQLRIINKEMTNLFTEVNYESYIKNNIYGLSILNMINDNETIATNGDITPYYFLDNKVIKIWDHSKLDKELYNAKNGFDLIITLKKYNIKYFAYSTFHFDPYYNPKIEEAIFKELKNCKVCFLGESKEGIFVFDLSKFN